MTLDHITVMRNDLSDADLELVPAKAKTPAKPSAPAPVKMPAPAVSPARKKAERMNLPQVSQRAPRPMWERVSLQMFGAEKE